MKIRTLVLVSLLSGTLFTSCKKDSEDVIDPNTPVKYLVRTDGYATADGEVTTSHAFYHYDVNDRLISRRLQTYTGATLDGDDSLVFVYDGALQSPSTVVHYDVLSSYDETVHLYYNSDGDLIKDSIQDVSATYYTYAGNKTYVTHSAYGYTTNDELTINTDGSVASAVIGDGGTASTTLTFQFNKSLLSPWWFNGSAVSKYMVAHEDDIEGIFAPFGKNLFAKITQKYVDTDPVEPYSETGSINLKYENISGGYPGKMIFSSPLAPADSYQLTFTYR